MPNHAKTVTVTGRAGVPDGHITAVLVNLQAAAASPGAWWRGARTPGRPATTNVRLNPGEPAPGWRSSGPRRPARSRSGTASQGTVTLSVDIVGYVAAKNAPPVAPPAPSDSHYIRTVIHGG